MTFHINPWNLYELLKDCHQGVLQVPNFQRSWVRNEDCIKSLIASISRAFPVGALTTIDAGGVPSGVPRPVEGAPAEARNVVPHLLLLDGQQRMTSLYQVTLRGKAVETLTSKNKKEKRWFYIDIHKALDATSEREEAIVAVPEDRLIRTDSGCEVVLDLSTPDGEYAALMYPVTQVFDGDNWQNGFDKHWWGNEHEVVRETFRDFKRQVLDSFWYYKMPVIALSGPLSMETLTAVFTRLNCNGTPLSKAERESTAIIGCGPEVH